MSWWKRLRSHRSEDREAVPDAPTEIPELETVGWYLHLEEANSASFMAVMRRLPYLVGRALGMAWQAAPGTTAAAVGLNVTAGAAVTFGLLATRGAAEAVLTAGPTWDRLVEAVPSLVVVGCAGAVRAGLGIAGGYAQARLKPLVTAAVEAEFFAVTTAVPLETFDGDDFADQVQLSRDRGTIAAAWLVDHTIDVITGLVGVTAVAVAVTVIHPALLVLLVIAVIPVGWAAVRAARVQYLSYQTRVTRRRRLWMLEQLMASRHTAGEMRAYGIGRWLLGQHQAMVSAETHADMTVIRQQTSTRIWGGLASGVATVGVYGVLVWLLAIGEVPLAGGAAAVLALQQGTGTMRLLVTAINSVYDEGLYFSDHTRFMAAHTVAAAPVVPAPRVDKPTIVVGSTAPKVVHLEDVSLRYPDAVEDAVSGVSLEIPHGHTIALVGENGSGKSSLAKLIACLYRPTAGRIMWDGTDIGDTDPDRLRRHIALVMQDFQNWPFSARTNIRIGRPNDFHNGHDIEAAAKAAGAHDMITGLPNGYETLLDKQYKDGVDLSGGQWQRIAAARAFHRASPILICDEPSAALDPKAEAAMFAHLKRRAGRATTILITHRLANIRHADTIVVLHEGRLVETGTHDRLITADGRYAQLFHLQASGYAV